MKLNKFGDRRKIERKYEIFNFGNAFIPEDINYILYKEMDKSKIRKNLIRKKISLYKC